MLSSRFIEAGIQGLALPARPASAAAGGGGGDVKSPLLPHQELEGADGTDSERRDEADEDEDRPAAHVVGEAKPIFHISAHSDLQGKVYECQMLVLADSQNLSSHETVGSGRTVAFTWSAFP